MNKCRKDPLRYSVSDRRETRSRDTSKELRLGLQEDREAKGQGGWDENSGFSPTGVHAID